MAFVNLTQNLNHRLNISKRNSNPAPSGTHRKITDSHKPILPFKKKTTLSGGLPNQEL
jgi:hypothetical protein